MTSTLSVRHVYGITKVKQFDPYYLHMPLEPISAQNQKQWGGVEKAVQAAVTLRNIALNHDIQAKQNSTKKEIQRGLF
ncbi:hypothetical protein ACFX2J_018538 [Malus domestica]